MDRIDPADASRTRWTFLGDLAVFEVKLLLDGTRDLLLSPVALVVSLVGLVLGGDQPGRWFYRLLAWGRESERWIDLFGGAERADQRPRAPQLEHGVDHVAERLRQVLTEQVDRGGVTASAKQAIDRLLDSAQVGRGGTTGEARSAAAAARSGASARDR